MRAEAEAVVRLGFPTGALAEDRTAFMRYRGQGHEVAVVLPPGRSIRRRYAPRSIRPTLGVYSRVIPGLEVEALTWTLALAQPFTLPERLPVTAGRRATAGQGSARMIDPASGETTDAAVYSARGAAAPACV